MIKRLVFFKDSMVDGEIKYLAGKEYDIDNSKGSADRWIKRLVAKELILPKVLVEAAEDSIKVEENKKQKVETKKKKKQDENVGQSDNIEL